MPRQPLPMPDRFWARVQKTTDCWLWQGRHNSDGYGELSYRTTRWFKAHRLSWELAYGPIPVGLHVLHHCDNRRCVRPDHLFLGTNYDNILDREAKGRGKKAIEAMRLKRTKLSSDQVTAIRRAYAGGGVTSSDLARQFGCSAVHVRHIIGGIRRQSSPAEEGQ